MFKPEYFVESIHDIDYSKFPNLKMVLFDIDNTIIAHHLDKPEENIIKYINNLKNSGYQVFLFSNGNYQRVSKIAEILNVKYLARVGKPSTKKLDKLIKSLGHNKDEVLIVGDQIFTDILCGKRYGIHTVLVEPISKDEPWYIRIKRAPESLIKITIKKY